MRLRGAGLLVAWLAVAAAAFGLDCPSLRLLPEERSDRLVAEGLVRKGRPRDGTNRRDRLRGLLSRPASGSEILVTVGSETQRLVLDERGAFRAVFSRPMGTGTISVSVADGAAGGAELRCMRQVLPATASLLVVSDVDDTILVSQVTKRLNLVWNSLLRSLPGRQPVAGTPEIYRNIYESTGGTGFFVYLSASPAALERFIGSFLACQGFPAGLLITGDGISGTQHQTVAHKSAWLERLSELFRGAPMLLVGDSGERDPEIYLAFAGRRLAPVKGIVIRLIEGFDAERETRIRREAAANGVPLLLWREPSELRAGLASVGVRIR
ncbi:MAG TPA: phosphatase domain-containing protein [Candidatus Ozemobacteraceae bacterium]